MNDVTREDVLTLAVRADRCGRRKLASNLYVVSELMGDAGGKLDRGIDEMFSGFAETMEADGRQELRTLAADGSNRAIRSGVGVAVGRAS